MQNSRLKPEIAAMLQAKQNQRLLLKLAIHFDITIGALKALISRQSSKLTTTAYEVQIRNVLGLKPNCEISEPYSPDEKHLSKHN